jgi:sec-independent protein translocase protein TatA
VFNFGPGEMIVLVLLVLLIFGPSQIPKMARGLGEAMREFRKAQREIHNELNAESSTPHRISGGSTTTESKPPENKPIE